MKVEVSIIIPTYNDVETLIGTLNSLYETIDIDAFEVIVVDDGGQHHLPEDFAMRKNMRYVEHFVNLGVGQAFDTGVRLAQSENLILMGADIRFEKNGWASRMLKVIKKEQKSVIATVCGSTKGGANRYAADLIFLVENKDLSASHPRKMIAEYRSILEGKWRPQTGRGIYEVPCLMGAFYGTTKSWYEYVGGFKLHYKWGVLEPYFSLKTWSMGGRVLIDTDNITYHIFNRNPQREALWDVLAYNQLMLSNVVFGVDELKYMQFLADSNTEAYKRGSDMMMEKIEAISQLARYVQDRRVMSAQELEKKMIDMSVHYHNPKNTYINPMTDFLNEKP